MTATPTGYWAPKGADAVLGLLAGDDTDVAKLAKAIETAHARCEVAIGPPSVAGAVDALALGAISHQNVAGFYSLATGNYGVVVSNTGLYRITATIVKTGTGSWKAGVSGLFMDVPSDGDVFPVCTAFRVTDATVPLRVVVDLTLAPTAVANCQLLVIERVGP